MTPPIFEIDPVAFKADPYPFYKEMRARAPICYVPQLDAVLLTRRDDIYFCEKNIEVFSSEQPGGLMTVLMGENMMRKDGEAHMRERRMIFPSVSPKTVAAVWKSLFEAKARQILDELEEAGNFDLVSEFAMRLSGEGLKILTGLNHVSWRDMNDWSQAMIDGIANYGGDKATEARCHSATRAIDDAISESMSDTKTGDQPTLLSVMKAAGLQEDSLRANIKLAISGGQNEQRDAIAGCAWALLEHPEQKRKVLTAEVAWMQVFDEYCRWIAPIGMSPRRIAKPYCHEGISLEPEQRAFLMFGSANRDEACFDHPDIFDTTRDTSKSIAFGAGPHFCAGAWASRCMVADVALPMLFERFPKLAIRDGDLVQHEGWAFRGLPTLPVAASA